ncbi:MAG: phosphate signaling complex protein PhoU [Candidatus Polarisedimenticolaceae bacterium]|nr:phosphate signaling complex protein PhoU [Candidatus Polarisedimenticolaceae bacterium]
MNKMTEGHTVKRFDEEMIFLHRLVLEIGGLAQDQLKRATQTLNDKDPSAAREVISRDQELNALDVQADEELINLIIKRQPMARDLREIITISKAVSDLERVGDEVRKIAQLTIHVYDTDSNPPNRQILRDINTMALFVGEMLEMSLTAFDELDAARALEVIRLDSELEEEYRSALRRLTTFVMEDSRTIGHMVDVVLGLRALERIGGHAKNIAGYVIFLITGSDVRHESLERIEAQII